MRATVILNARLPDGSRAGSEPARLVVRKRQAGNLPLWSRFFLPAFKTPEGQAGGRLRIVSPQNDIWDSPFFVASS